MKIKQAIAGTECFKNPYKKLRNINLVEYQDSLTILHQNISQFKTEIDTFSLQTRDRLSQQLSLVTNNRVAITLSN